MKQLQPVSNIPECMQPHVLACHAVCIICSKIQTVQNNMGISETITDTKSVKRTSTGPNKQHGFIII